MLPQSNSFLTPILALNYPNMGMIETNLEVIFGFITPTIFV